MSSFPLHVVTPTGEFYSGEAEYMSYRAPDGIVGVMKDALPRIAVLEAGELCIKTSVVEMCLICGDGIVIIDKSGVTVLSEKCRYNDDTSESDAEQSDGDKSDYDYKTAKARIAASIKRMNNKNPQEF